VSRLKSSALVRKNFRSRVHENGVVERLLYSSLLVELLQAGQHASRGFSFAQMTADTARCETTWRTDVLLEIGRNPRRALSCSFED